MKPGNAPILRFFGDFLACSELLRRAAKGFFGGAEGIRTPDLRSAIAALSQLSYGPAAGTNRPSRLPAFSEFGPFRAVDEACQWPARSDRTR
jgi:hypothetical protein